MQQGRGSQKTFFWTLVLVLTASWLGIIAAAACSSMGQYDETRSNLSDTEKKNLDEFRAELEIGRSMAGRLLQFYGTQKSEELLAYVNTVGAYVARFSVAPERRYMFEILDDESVNAFACPGGYILVTMGAIRHAKNEAELAAVLGHEISHVANRHMFDKLRTMSEADLAKAEDIAKKKLELPSTVRARERPKGNESEFGATLAKYLSGSTAGLNILKAAGAGMGVILESGLGAEKEVQADQEGTTYAASAGYEPQALEQFLCRLSGAPLAKNGSCTLADKQKRKKKSEYTVLDKTHPAPSDRIVEIRKALTKMGAATMVGAEGEERFAQVKSKTVGSL